MERLWGERDPQELAKLRDPHIKASEEVVAKSLEGNWRPELLFVLKQESESFQTFQEKIKECDQALCASFARESGAESLPHNACYVGRL